MADGFVARVNYLTFDIFGTVMDLSVSLTGPAGEFLAAHGSAMADQAFYAEWRERQRIEQYQDNLLMLGHSGYLETCRRAFVYCLKKHNVSYTAGAVQEFMKVYKGLQPYGDAVEGLRSLAAGRYKLVALSNGEQWVLGGIAGQQRPDKVRRDNIRGPSWRIQAIPRDIPQGDTASGVRARGDHDGRGARFRYPGPPGLRLQSGLRQPVQTPHGGLGVPA